MTQSTRSERSQRRANKIRNQRIIVISFGIILLAAILFMIFQSSNDQPVSGANPTTLSNGLVIEDLQAGEGAPAQAGDLISVHYTGWLTDGTKFDSSLDRNQPFSFTLGAGDVIPGWDQGVDGMQVGGKRKLTIPPELAYGADGIGGVIPPNATLVFEVELLEIQ